MVEDGARHARHVREGREARRQVQFRRADLLWVYEGPPLRHPQANEILAWARDLPVPVTPTVEVDRLPLVSEEGTLFGPTILDMTERASVPLSALPSALAQRLREQAAEKAPVRVTVWRVRDPATLWASVADIKRRLAPSEEDTDERAVDHPFATDLASGVSPPGFEAIRKLSACSVGEFSMGSPHDLYKTAR